MYLNPNNPHHGVDCICDSCWKYWGQYARTMAKAVAAQRSTEQAIDASGEGGDSTSVQEADSGEKRILPPLIEEGKSPCERDCATDPQAGNPLTYLSGGELKYKVEHVEFDNLNGFDEYWFVVDFQGATVAQCAKKHNAMLICNLLNNHS